DDIQRAAAGPAAARPDPGRSEAARPGAGRPAAAPAPPAPPAPGPAPIGRTGTGAAGDIAALMNTVPQPGVGYRSYKLPPYLPKEGDEVVAFSRRRRITADHMVYSTTVSPHVVTVAEIDIHATSLLRDQHKRAFKAEGVSLTFLTFVVAATVKALREYPKLNSRILDDAYVQFKDINVGVAVDTPSGLLVASIKNTDQLSLRGIAMQITDLASRARVGKITADDLSGVTFTVSNPGRKGNLFGGAIISQPNVGILRVGEIKKRPVVVESGGGDAIAIHPVMYSALSYDHRVVDGVEANEFLWRISDILTRAEFEI
ncbi:MAG: 2-oxo acid dehydrogenase subunit E2, partial [Myxococcota bacterium]